MAQPSSPSEEDMVNKGEKRRGAGELKWEWMNSLTKDDAEANAYIQQLIILFQLA